MTWKHAISRSSLRLASALVMLSFVICHLTAHAFLLVSLETAGKVLDFLMFPWRTLAGTVLLATAFVVHFSNALWSIYIRRSLRLIRWEWAQLLLGLCIPALLIPHVSATRVAASAFDVTSYYNTVLLTQWLFAPWLGVLQVLGVLTVWTHACIGIHFWLRTKVWYPDVRIWLFGIALLLPALALAGYVSAGNEVLREAKDPDYVREFDRGCQRHPRGCGRCPPDRIRRLGHLCRARAVAVCRARHPRLVSSPPPAADAGACGRTQRADPAWSDGAGDAA